MPPRLELAGARFGRLVVLERAGKDRFRAWLWQCQCDCGRRVVVRGSTLAAGKTSACASCATRESHTTHGATGTVLYQRWRAMLDRTTRSSSSEYHNYGGRGIRVCERWRSYAAFAKDMGPAFSPELELDRVDVDGDYSPDNCRWATRREQQRNKRNNHFVEWRGRRMTVQDWSETLGIKANTLVYRLRRGWSTERALTKGATPDVLLSLANEDG